VVFTVQYFHFKRILTDLLSNMGVNERYLLVGTDGWAPNDQVCQLPGAKKLLGGVLIGLELPQDNGFIQHMRNVSQHRSHVKTHTTVTLLIII
jgi:hypothetical protein